MSAPTPAPSRQKHIFQAAILVGMLLVCVIVMAAAFRGGNQLPMGPQREAAPEAPSQATPSAFAEAAAPFRFLQERMEQRPPGSEGEGSSAPAGPSIDELERMLQGIGDRGGSAPTYSPSSAQADPRGSLAAKAVEARSSPLRGVVESPETPAGGAGQGSSAAGTLPAGTLIEAHLTQSVSSDYPGSPWVAQVSRPVHTPAGLLAIPQGSILIGAVEQDRGPNSVIQGRVVLRLSRIVRPDGVDFAVQAPVLDSGGVGAIPGKTKRHVLAQAAGVLASAMLGAAKLGTASDAPVSARSQIEQDAMQGAAQQVAPVAQRYLTVSPTVVPPAGTPVRVRLTEALVVPFVTGV